MVPLKDKKGIALIMALWIMTMLLVVAASFAFMMRTELKMATNFRNEMQAHYLARAGVEKAIAILRNDTNSYDHLGEDWATIGTLSLGRGQCIVTVEDEQGKVNINTATPVDGTGTSPGGLLDGIYNPSESGRTYTNNLICISVRKIRDCRDADTDGDQESVSPNKDRPFDTAREIAKIDGLGLSEFNDGYITIYGAVASESGTNEASYSAGNNVAGYDVVNINTAPYSSSAPTEGPLRAVVGIVLDPLDGVGLATCDTYAQNLYDNRNYTTVSEIDTKNVLGNEAREGYLVDSEYFTVSSNYFRIISTGYIPDATNPVAQRKIEAIVYRGVTPIQIKYWSETVFED